VAFNLVVTTTTLNYPLTIVGSFDSYSWELVLVGAFYYLRLNTPTETHDTLLGSDANLDIPVIVIIHTDVYKVINALTGLEITSITLTDYFAPGPNVIVTLGATPMATNDMLFFSDYTFTPEAVISYLLQRNQHTMSLPLTFPANTIVPNN
jgi:hypothetical protein